MRLGKGINDNLPRPIGTQAGLKNNKKENINNLGGSNSIPALTGGEVMQFSNKIYHDILYPKEDVSGIYVFVFTSDISDD